MASSGSRHTVSHVTRRYLLRRRGGANSWRVDFELQAERDYTQGFEPFEEIHMLGQMMQVGFYGHVRQYKNIQAEIDANIKRVIESGEYVQGPMLKQFEQELAAFHGTSHAIGVGNGT